MSVKVHEAYSLDSSQDRLLWWDDFLGDQIQDEWDSTIAGAGTTVVVDAQTGGVVRFTTGALTGNSNILDWSDIRSLLVDKKVTIEFRVKLTQTTDIVVRLALHKDGNEFVRFIYNSATAVWRIETSNVVNTQVPSDVVVDTDYHIFRIECFPTGEVHFYIDGTEVNVSPLTTNIPDDAADFLQPFIRIITQADVAKSMDIDYVVVRQEI